MNISQNKTRTGGFTLVELLVVIGIIALLAAVIVPAAGMAARTMRIRRATAELHQMGLVIERYKAQKGYYPPDNTNDAALPQLFYELTGSYLVDGVYHRINGSETNTQASVQSVFYVGGFMNASQISSLNNQAEIKEAEARNFWPGLEPGKYALYSTNGVTVAVMGLPIEGPYYLTTIDNRQINPWHYNEHNPTNNPSAYDLWIDLTISAPVPGSGKAKTYRICNWSEQPVILQ